MQIGSLINTLGVNKIAGKTQTMFCAKPSRVESDRFERQNDAIEVNLYNPISDRNGKAIIKRSDLDSKCTFTIKPDHNGLKPMIAEYDPSMRGELYNHNTCEKFPVNILKTTCEDNPEHYVYNFMSEDLSHCYGYVWFAHFNDDTKIQPPELRFDYPKYGIEGDRIIIEYLRNFDDFNIGGVEDLANKLEVKFCKEHGINNILSVSDVNSHVSHYKRGKRFVIPPLYSDDFNFLYEKYGNYNPNEVLEKLIKESDGSPIDLDGWGCMMMYLPKEKFDEYAEQDE